ncbi:20296_t:CDS:2 [Dentiscutata erythropus]|uniref:20296_t:CDS:1 n=1 Tax=Dentiscutata erythropus TaxID=1348616 RepID=A0A9N9HNA2_9GLOM|nr:20296_t:CDS:2 [Dentiscutata erythropus]
MGRSLRVVVVGAFTSTNSLLSLEAFICVIFGAFNVVVLEAFTSVVWCCRFWKLSLPSILSFFEALCWC